MFRLHCPLEDAAAAAALVMGVALLVAGCSGSNASSSAAPLASSGTGAVAGAQPSGGSGTSTRVNIDEIFPPDQGRDLMLQYCVNCHTITPTALARRTPGEWATHRLDHQPRVGGLSDAQADLLWGYLVKHLAPGRPIPELPPDLLNTWTSY